MTDQDSSEHEPQNPLPGGTGDTSSPARPWSAGYPAPAAPDSGETRPLPPFQQPPSATPTAPLRRPRGIAAAVLAGSLLVGGAAGVGGAAWYDAWQGDDS